MLHNEGAIKEPFYYRMGSAQLSGVKLNMKNTFLIAIDAGSTKIKTAVYDVGGNLIATSESRAPRETNNPGLSDAQLYYNTVLKCVEDTVEQIGAKRTDVHAIVFTGQMAGAVGIDKDWNPVTLWSGTMHSEHIPYYKSFPNEYHQNLLTICGTNSPFLLPKIKWMEHTFGDAPRAVKYLILGNYVAGRMAGIDIEDAFIDRTLLEWTGCADLKQDTWSPYLCGLAGMDMTKLARIVQSSTVIGYLKHEAAAACGLPDGIPLVAGAGDKPAGCIGAGVVRPGQLIDESSTVGALSQCLDKFIPDTKHHMLETIPSPIAGEYYSMVYFTGSGATVEWFYDTICGGEKDAAHKAGTDIGEWMNDKAACIPPGSDGLLAIGMLNGRALPFDPDVRGLWVGHSWNHLPQHFYRALLESYGYEYACALNAMQDTYPQLHAEEIRVIGGGAVSALYNRIKADILGKVYVGLNRADLTMLGAAIIGGHAVGIYDDIKETAESFVQIKNRIEPDPLHHNIYKKYVDVYASSFDRLRPLYEGLNRIEKL